MKKILIIAFALFLGCNVYSQTRRDRMGNPMVSNRQPTEQEIEKRKREIEERKQEYITNFISTLKADDFQKQIIKQTLDSYFVEKLKLYQVKYEHQLDREKAIKALDEAHFKELEELISKEDMDKIKEMIKGNFDDKEVKKEKKKKKKRRKKKKKKEEDEDNNN